MSLSKLHALLRKKKANLLSLICAVHMCTSIGLATGAWAAYYCLHLYRMPAPTPRSSIPLPVALQLWARPNIFSKRENLILNILFCFTLTPCLLIPFVTLGFNHPPKCYIVYFLSQPLGICFSPLEYKWQGGVFPLLLTKNWAWLILLSSLISRPW